MRSPATTSARAVTFHGNSDYADRSNWDRLLPLFKQDGCTAGWVLMQSGDEPIGRALIERTIDYLENESPRHIRRPERYSTALCHASLGQESQAPGRARENAGRQDLLGMEVPTALATDGQAR